MDPQLQTTLLELLTWLVGGGAGILATWGVGALRTRFPLPAEAPTNELVRLGYALVYAPRYTRIAVMVSTLLLTALAKVGLSALGGGSWGDAVQTEQSALFAFLVSQVVHALKDMKPDPAYKG